MAIRAEDRRRVLDIVSRIYSGGYSDAMASAAREYGIESSIERAALRMESDLSVRLDLVDDAVDTYARMIREKAKRLADEGIVGDRLWAEMSDYARNLADNRSEIVAQMEHAQGGLDGAGNIVDEAGMKYKWRFPHFELGRKGHVECQVCEGIRGGSPYTIEEAEENGFPLFPHPACDHGWVIVPEGGQARTEEFPPS